ncbi:hypothetical protein CDL15_Pgr018472 [Punica granatum]|uniref:NHL repeat-containing protein 2 n=1 Tax=Punica granatum TaxID=22663 RepID=A0A218WZ29_PUNGR|nr:hypothetical protein CDL15_Pgr018472 [Punica granatum]
MAARCRRLRVISRFLPRVLSGQPSSSMPVFVQWDGYVFASSIVLSPRTVNLTDREIGGSQCLIHRFPHLYVMGLKLGNVAVHQNDLVQSILEEYITFPILVVHKNFSEIPKGSSYILLEDSTHPVFYLEENLDLEIIDKATKKLNNQCDKESKLFDSSTWILKQNNVKEPYLCSAMQNILLFSPGCISADESGDRLFVSDSNHHRIIVADRTGKILDCIGSSPGFEDGDFESAKLFRPGSTLYDDADDCLYIVDSENHAIRRADMSRRIIETVYPEGPSNSKSNTFWTWIKSKLGLHKEVVVDSETSDTEVLTFPWHLLQASDSQVYIISRRFETLWILDSSSWELKETITGFQQVVAVCQELIVEKMSLLKQLPRDQLHQRTSASFSLEDQRHLSLVSSVATLGDYIIACDPVGCKVSRLCRESGAILDIEFSNFGILGLPYWMSFPLERVYPIVNQIHSAHIDHNQHFSLLPGRVEIKLNVGLPADTELVEPLKDSSIWRQARGAATEVLGSQGVVGSSEKVGVAQQWYDELDNLAFTTTEMESDVQHDNNAINTQDDKVHIDCVVHTSPGTSEVIIYAALYLKLKANPSPEEGNWEKQVARLAELLVPSKRGKIRSSCRQILLSLRSDLQNLIFVKPVQVRIRINSKDHPKADNSKDIILSESSIQVDVSL